MPLPCQCSKGGRSGLAASSNTGRRGPTNVRDSQPRVIFARQRWPSIFDVRGHAACRRQKRFGQRQLRCSSARPGRKTMMAWRSGDSACATFDEIRGDTASCRSLPPAVIDRRSHKTAISTWHSCGVSVLGCLRPVPFTMFSRPSRPAGAIRQARARSPICSAPNRCHVDVRTLPLGFRDAARDAEAPPQIAPRGWLPGRSMIGWILLSKCRLLPGVMTRSAGQ
jgi:hypothetical protein